MKSNWWKKAVVYQIYPRSFADSNGDGIGDLKGITAHLDYLKELGVDAVWVSPYFASPNDDNGYDISDYRAIMPEFGTMEDWEEMIAGMHKRGMRLVMDLVANHSSDEHAWFVESRKNRENPYRDYYIWRDPVDGHEPNNWGSCFSGSAWEFDETTGQYYLHLFSKKQPDLNWANPKVRDEIFDMMTFWCDKGVDGFRMDVIGMIGKENYNDGPKSPNALFGDFHDSCCHTETTHRYIQEMRRRVLDNYDLLTVGEAGGTAEGAVRYTNLDGSELNMIFSFDAPDDICHDAPLGKWNDNPADLPTVRAAFNRWQQYLAKDGWNSLYLSNHDQARQVSRYGNDSELFRVRSAKMLATMVHMMRGTPYIYQGEELGMTNAYFTRLEQYQDIEVHNYWRERVETGLVHPEDMLRYLARISRDNARTPMQWTADPNAGFTTGKPWLEINPNHAFINAEAAVADPDSVFHYYRRLIELRHTMPIIVEGTFEPLLEDDPSVYAYRRVLGDQKLTVLLNWTDRNAACELKEQLKGTELISNYKQHKTGELLPYEAIVILEN